ncbi:hypothetical protein BT63DRAFT_430466 [Microthyrium microscopicum]|uniref:ADP-ribosylglycohydrolase n=1 Tax=Microthyrium microscopicum TaxID=703497 RepID=A0A6A6TT88_9PEZI|nr:hypothetical protein BT63DRAFT_430466 [Microthyrium microscopicum]
MEGGDADTNCCFAGALLGAFYGFKDLPPNWKDGLLHRVWLVNKAVGLCQLVGLAPYTTFDPKDHLDAAVDGGRGSLSKEQLDARNKKFRAEVKEKLNS